MKTLLAKLIGLAMDKLPKTNIKEIQDKDGNIYFRRNSFFTSDRLSIVEHEFYQDLDDPVFDKDDTLHSHPRAFISMIIDGGYVEEYITNPSTPTPRLSKINHVGSINFVNRSRYHIIKTLLKGPTFSTAYCRSLCISFKNHTDWTYLVLNNNIVELLSNDEFRKRKKNLE